MCKFYYSQTSSFGLIPLIVNSYSYIIVIAAFLIRELLIWLAKKIRFMNLTSETNFIMLSVFYMTLFNYAFVPLFSPWDAREFQNMRFLNNFLFRNGLYTDFNSGWFQEVGYLVCANMISNAYWPIIEFGYTWAMRLGYRMLD